MIQCCQKNYRIPSPFNFILFQARLLDVDHEAMRQLCMERSANAMRAAADKAKESLAAEAAKRNQASAKRREAEEAKAQKRAEVYATNRILAELWRRRLKQAKADLKARRASQSHASSAEGEEEVPTGTPAL